MASTSTRRNGRRKSPWVGRVKRAIVYGFVLLSIAVIGAFSLFFAKYKEAEQAMVRLPELMAEVGRGPSKILTADGKVLFQISEENRIPLHLSQIPKHVQQAILAAEDKRFYEHNGVDGTGLVRAFVSVFREGRVAQGGSTITMQLAKRLYNGNERSFMRKVQDIAFATAMEREIVNKDKILELYLNQIYFGMGAHGIGAAAKIYFNKPVEKLTISDAAILARCVRLPSKENPYRDLDTAMHNRDVVLGIMRDERMIGESQYETALAEKPRLNPNPPTTTAFYPEGYGRHFVQHVLQFIEDQNLGVDLKRGGFSIYTTLDSRLQKLAELTVRKVVRENRGQKVTEGAFVAIDKDGKILCEVGGVDPVRNQTNIVTQGKLQPGSAFKAIVYSTALRENTLSGPYDSISNAPIHVYDEWTHKTWSPQNASRRENASSYSLRTAFALSVNLPAIHTSDLVGRDHIQQAAYDIFGFHSEIQAVKSMALGVNEVTPLEMAEAYSIFTLGGDRVHPYPVTRIEAADGELVRSFAPQRFAAVLEPRVCSVMDDLMHAVVTNGTAYGVLGQAMPDARGKTGTTNSAKDAWFCGYVDGITGIGWVGNHRKVGGRWTLLPMASSVYGGTVTTLIWRDIMKSARERFGVRIGPSAVDLVAAKVAPGVAKIEHTQKPIEPVTDPDLEKTEEKGPETVLVPAPDETPAVNPDETSGTKPEAGTEQDPTVAPVGTETPTESKPADAKPSTDKDRRRDSGEKPKESSGPASTESVTVEVCVDSGRLATAYCPETVMRTYPRGRAPRRRCRIHGTDDR